MSQGKACECPERKEPMTRDDDRPARLWRWKDYKANYSAFNGYRYTPSDYSACVCLACGASWRTKANWPLDGLRESDRAKLPGGPNHETFMSFIKEARK
jgi:hypothetical protein